LLSARCLGGLLWREWRLQLFFAARLLFRGRLIADLLEDLTSDLDGGGFYSKAQKQEQREGLPGCVHHLSSSRAPSTHGKELEIYEIFLTIEPQNERALA